MIWPSRVQQAGLVILLAVLAGLALVRAYMYSVSG
jgi:hypothetical protein